MNNKGLVALFLLLMTAGCATSETTQSPATPTQVEISLASVTAEFTTRVYGNGNDSLAHAQLWRSPARIEWLDVETNTSEVWTKTSQNLWFYSKVFHTDQHVIEYSPVDLNLLQAAPAWQSFAAAINPELLQALPKVRELKPMDGFERVQYRGAIGPAVYEVDWLPELSLSSRVKMVAKGITQVTELKRPLLTSDKTTEPQDIRRYRVIEYSDLGDMERDPFVIKVQHSLMGVHEHAH